MKSYRLRERAHDNLLDDILLSRGVGPEEHGVFLEPDFARDSHDPYLLPDMEVAVARILSAAKHNEKVCVWSDYDADGIPGGVMLTEFLRTLGLDIVHYIPHRHEEGYGLNEGGIAKFAEQKIALIITVDLGTTDAGPVAFAKSKGIDIVVTDHHVVHGVMPEALAVINPKRPDSRYPFADLCGAGVAWKLVQAILQKGHPLNYAQGKEKWLLDLVGIATLSDMVPLRGENRMLAHFGLAVLRRNRRVGLAALLKLLRIEPRNLTEDDVGFMISPRINAASRMDSPEAAARLLAAQEAGEAVELARALNKINDERKGLVAATVKEANRRLVGRASPVIVLGSPKWRPGILGLVANNLAQVHGKPVCLWGQEGGAGMLEGPVRGSCRGEGLNIVEWMEGARELFDDYGGHAGSGGFSLARERVHELPMRLAASYEAATSHVQKEEVTLEREMDIAELPNARSALLRLAPFGVGWGKPLFIFPRLSIAAARAFGKEQNHVELTLANSSAQTKGVSFFTAPTSYTKKFSIGDRADVVGHVEQDWRGAPRIRVVDIL